MPKKKKKTKVKKKSSKKKVVRRKRKKVVRRKRKKVIKRKKIKKDSKKTNLSNELIIKIEESIRSSDNESVVGTVAYSFGIAPRITGFAYLTSSGKLFKFENKNPQKLGDEVKLVTQLSKTQRFISFGRTTYGDDIKQFFTAVTENGNIFTSEDLDSWSKVASIPLTK